MIHYQEYPTLLDFERREVPSIPVNAIGETYGGGGYTKSMPREWTDAEIEWMLEMKLSGYTNIEIADSLGRTETSVSIKLKRIGKSGDTYNEKHRCEKYDANISFFQYVKPKTILDAYCGTERWWMNNCEGCAVISNDANKEIQATYNMPADKLIARLYADDYSFDLIDLDPFGSAYDCFDQSIKMAKRGIIITLGEMGHKRWKRLDFVKRYYGIESLSEFTTERLINEIIKIGRRNKKELVPVIVKEWPRISRVYFEIKTIKITEQWEKN